MNEETGEVLATLEGFGKMWGRMACDTGFVGFLEEFFKCIDSGQTVEACGGDNNVIHPGDNNNM